MTIIDIADVFAGRPPSKVEITTPTQPVAMVAMRDVGLSLAPLSALDRVEVGGEPDPNRRLQAGDVIVTTRGRVRAAVAQMEHAGVLLGPNLMLLRPRDGFPPALLAAFLRHPLVEDQLLAEMGGAGTPGFSLETLRSLELNELTAERASELAALVEETDAYRSELETGAARLSQAAAATVYAQLVPNQP